MQFNFGAGVLFARRTDIANPTPMQFGGLQDVSVDISFTNKQLYGSRQFPIAVARGTGKVGGKAKMASFQAQALNDIFFNEASNPATGQRQAVIDEAGTIPGTPYQITVANGATMLRDLGVRAKATGLYLLRVASAPATGQYSVNEVTGVYTFAAADTTLVMAISYQYTLASPGKTITITNKLLGDSATFAVILTSIYKAKRLTLELNECVSSKLTLPTKLDDFWIPEFDFEANADASDVIGYLSLAE